MRHHNNQSTHERPTSSNNFASRLLHRALSDRKRPTSEMERAHSPNDGQANGLQKTDVQASAVAER